MCGCNRCGDRNLELICRLESVHTSNPVKQARICTHTAAHFGITNSASLGAPWSNDSGSARRCRFAWRVTAACVCVRSSGLSPWRTCCVSNGHKHIASGCGECLRRVFALEFCNTKSSFSSKVKSEGILQCSQFRFDTFVTK